MADDDTTSNVTAANPTLPEEQQRELDYAAVRVQVEGITATQRVPSRRVVCSNEPLSVQPAPATRVLTEDLSRRRASLILRSGTATDQVLYQSNSSGQAVAWPANVALVLEHCDEMWAVVPSGQTGTLTVITEHWAD
jgi:hypothetical protein